MPSSSRMLLTTEILSHKLFSVRTTQNAKTQIKPWWRLGNQQESFSDKDAWPLFPRVHNGKLGDWNKLIPLFCGGTAATSQPPFWVSLCWVVDLWDGVPAETSIWLFPKRTDAKLDITSNLWFKVATVPNYVSSEHSISTPSHSRRKCEQDLLQDTPSKDRMPKTNKSVLPSHHRAQDEQGFRLSFQTG